MRKRQKRSAVEKLEGTFPGAYEGRLSKEKILAAVPKIAAFRIHLCGPPGMMKAMHAVLDELKVPKDQIKEESFGGAKSPPSKVPAAAPAGVPAPAAGQEPTVNVNEKAEAAPASAGATLKKVLFKKAGKTVEIKDGESVLELSETSGVEIPFQCRVGTCGVCKVQLISGDVTMAVQDALTEEDKTAGTILACQAMAQSDLEIEEP